MSPFVEVDNAASHCIVLFHACNSLFYLGHPKKIYFNLGFA